PVFFLFEENQFQWGYGNKQLRGRSTTVSTDGIKDTEFTMYKDMVGDFLMLCGFPTPIGKNCYDEEEIVDEALKLGFPVVVKPVAGHKGQGVVTGIETEEGVKKAFNAILTLSEEEGINFEGAIVQQQIYGTDHRLLAVGSKFAAALERVPAFVDGNGKDTIEDLIAEENDKEIRLDNARSPLAKIHIDDDLKDYLSLQDLSLQSVPAEGEKIYLRRVANISAGGVSINVTDKIHPKNIKMVEDIAGFFNVKCLGIDVLAADISKPWTDGNFGIIEINAGPGVFMHLAPAYGGSIDVPGLFIKSHFHKNEYSRVPIIAGNNISQNFAKMLNDKLHEIKPDIYFSSLTDEGIHFNGEYFFKNENHDENVKIILRNPKTEIALFTHNFDDIFDYGILHEGADIIILNNPHYAEEKTLKEQLLPGGILIEVRDDEIIVSGEEPEHLSIPVENAEDKDAKLLEVIEPYLEKLIVKYD
ncbi:MAG: acetate--CoA ligase family protein, partial [Bacteroidales bacterium]|nr:acetate--CoA ligase family protein [Bacteroidales bacterium]